MSQFSISPTPSDEEAAAIVAAIEFGWPRPYAAATTVTPEQPTRWRFSGRWWNGALPLRRQRG